MSPVPVRELRLLIDHEKREQIVRAGWCLNCLRARRPGMQPHARFCSDRCRKQYSWLRAAREGRKKAHRVSCSVCGDPCAYARARREGRAPRCHVCRWKAAVAA